MSEKRQQLMATAYRLFNRHGFHATGIDRIWAEAGSTKRTLYRHFPTKDALIEAVLLSREQEFFALLDGFGEWFGRSDFYGCNFINASAEFADPRHPVRKLVVAHKQALLNWVRVQLGCSIPQATGLCLLLEGAVVMAHSYQQPLALVQARSLALALLCADDDATVI